MIFSMPHWDADKSASKWKILSSYASFLMHSSWMCRKQYILKNGKLTTFWRKPCITYSEDKNKLKKDNYFKSALVVIKFKFQEHMLILLNSGKSRLFARDKFIFFSGNSSTALGTNEWSFFGWFRCRTKLFFFSILMKL